MAVVARWFGGIKLGKGGLARAYAGRGPRSALQELPVVARAATARVAVEIPYEKVGAVKRLLRPPEIELAGGGATARRRGWCSPSTRSGEAALREALAELGVVPPGIDPREMKHFCGDFARRSIILVGGGPRLV